MSYFRSVPSDIDDIIGKVITPYNAYSYSYNNIDFTELCHSHFLGGFRMNIIFIVLLSLIIGVPLLMLVIKVAVKEAIIEAHKHLDSLNTKNNNMSNTTQKIIE